METVFPCMGEKPLELLGRCGGFYSCPKDAQGKRRGPLVGYTGRYGPDKKQYVGDIYANFAKAEQHGPALTHFAREIVALYDEWEPKFTGFCGAPEGGKALAVVSASLFSGGRQYIFPEKKITALAAASSREESKLVFDRHEPEPGTKWWIVEDVCNNFSTTKTLVKLIESLGASVGGVCCFLNRSLEVGDSYQVREDLILPVWSLVRQPIMQWQQDDPEVAEDIAVGNVVWKPKNEWSRLAEAMAAHPAK